MTRPKQYRETTWVNPAIEPRSSPIAGLGLFALDAIEAGAVISELGGTLLTDDEVRALTPPYSSLALAENLNLLIAQDSIIRFGNHSCEPNCWMTDAVTEVALRRIEAGEEITIDYATHTVMPDWSMPCSCGSRLCRRVITGDDWRRPDLQQRYGGHWSPFIVARIEAASRDGG